MRNLLALLIVLALVALGLWFFVGSEGPAPVVGGDSRGADEKAPARLEASPLEKQAGESGREKPARASAAAPRADAPAAPVADDHLAEIKGRCLLPTGAPAADVAIEVHGWAANDERVIRHGEPEHWRDPAATTGADGRFSIRFDPPLAYQFVLNARAAGFAKASWRWNDIQPGDTKDVGDVELLRGGAIVGRIVDANGSVLKDGWTVYAESVVSGDAAKRAGGRDATRDSEAVDRTTGEFRIEAMPPGPVTLRAHAHAPGWVDAPLVDVRAGEVVEVVIRYEGPDIGSRIVVNVSTRPFHPFAAEVEGLRLRGPGIEPRAAARDAPYSTSFSFDGLPPGSYSIAIDDRKFKPWSKDGIAPGTSVDAELEGSAGVRLEIVDAKTGKPVVPSGIRTRFEGVSFRPNEFSVLERGKKMPASGAFDGLIPVPQTLFVSAEGYADCELPLPALRPTEVKSLRAEMLRGNRLAGRVVMGKARSPAVDAEVEIVEVRDADTTGGFTFTPELSRAHVMRTDASGRFAFSMVTSGKQTVRASYSVLVSTEAVVDMKDNADTLDVVLTLPDCSYLTGKIRGPDGASFDGLTVLVVPADQDVRALRRAIGTAAEQQLAASIAADGSFRAGPLELGEAQVSLRLPTVMLPVNMKHSVGTKSETIHLGSVALVAGQETHREFDVRANFPGRIDVALRVNGSPAPGTVIEVRSTEHPTVAVGAAFADTSPSSKSNPLVCNGYRLLARAVDMSWAYLAPQTVVVKAGETASTSIDVTLIEGALQMLDDNGLAARVVKKVSIVPESENPQHAVARVYLSTSSDGKLALKLPTGSYRLYEGYGTLTRDAVSARFEMTPSGPEPASLEFPR